MSERSHPEHKFAFDRLIIFFSLSLPPSSLPPFRGVIAKLRLALLQHIDAAEDQ